jgi:hypothetical protein
VVLKAFPAPTVWLTGLSASGTKGLAAPGLHTIPPRIQELIERAYAWYYGFYPKKNIVTLIATVNP